MNSNFAVAAIVSNPRAGRIEAVRAVRVAAWMLCVALCAASTFASDDAPPVSTFCNGIRLQDEIVVVNTRMLCGNCNSEALREDIIVENYAVHDDAGHRRWQRSDLESFLAVDSAVPTIIFVHGNQMTPGEAKSQGLGVYRRLAHYGSGEPIRFVIYSWPSERVGRLLRDVQTKAVRTGPAGCQLGWLVDQMPAETHVSLIGYSFGARIVTGGLHVLAGGRLGRGMEIADPVHSDRPPIDVVLIAAALHCHWLGEGQYHGLAMTQVDKMFLLNNRNDLALRYYRFSTAGRDNPQALGLHGPGCLNGEYASKIYSRDVSQYAGRQHDLFMFLCAPGATAQVWGYTDPAATKSDAEPVALRASVSR